MAASNLQSCCAAVYVSMTDICDCAEMARSGGAGPVGAQGVPGPPAHQGQEGLGDPAVHRVGQGQRPTVLA